MIKRLITIVLSVVTIVSLSLFVACKKSSDDSSSGSGGNGSSGSSTAPTISVSAITGFEDEDSAYVIEGGNGVELSMNAEKKYVRTGNGSLKLSVSRFASAEFGFSENIKEKVITDYDFLSFWLYSDFDGTLALTNTAVYSDGKGEIICGGISKGEWTQVKILKGSDAFGVIQYNLSFNKFVLMATGKDFGAVVNYDAYIDDIRLYKEGGKGECEMALEVDSVIIDKMPTVEVGKDYRLPDVCVFSPAGYRIAGANENCAKRVTDENGKAVSVSDGVMNVSVCGKYVYECEYVYDGIVNVLRKEFTVAFGECEEFYLGVATVGREYEITVPELKKVGSDELVAEADCAVSVEDPSGNACAVTDLKFIPSAVGEYKITYEFTLTSGGVKNSLVVEKNLYSNAVAGLIADFSTDQSGLFELSPGASGIFVGMSTDRYKPAENGNKGAYKITSSGVNTVAISLTDSFPFRNADGKKYLSMWIYNGSNAVVTAELTSCGKTVALSPLCWNQCVFRAEDFIGDFAHSDLLFYDFETHSKLNCDFFIDDIRLIGEGDEEEVVFAPTVCENEYDSATGEGVMYAANTTYEIDLALYDFDSNRLAEKAEVVSVKDKRNRTVKVTDGRYFVPVLPGIHTVTLRYKNGNVLCTSERTINVTEQILISPNSKFLLSPGEVGTTYRFDMLPEIWNHGVKDSSVKPYIYVNDPSGKLVVEGKDEFVPSASGKYGIIFLVNDEQTSSNAMYECTLIVYPKGKIGVVADFEDKDISMMQSTTYYYGEVSDFSLSDKFAYSGKYSAVFSNVNDGTRELKFGLTADSLADDISKSKYFSFRIYIEDEKESTQFYIKKTQYADWIDERDKSFVTGSLSQRIESNRWVEVRIEREDYETVLGGVIFAGYTVNLGGSLWAAQNNDYITMFSVMSVDNGAIRKGVNVYIDDITLGY